MLRHRERLGLSELFCAILCSTIYIVVSLLIVLYLRSTPEKTVLEPRWLKFIPSNTQPKLSVQTGWTSCRHTVYCPLQRQQPPPPSEFRQRYSTETALLLVYNDIIRAVDHGHVVAMMLLDLSSAFDTVDHNTLLSILSSKFLISGQALTWFRSYYLTDRSQVFTTDSTHSPPIPLNAGVPKVLVLAPCTQFIAYTLKTPPISFHCTISNIICSLMTLSLMVTVQFLIFLTLSSASRNGRYYGIHLKVVPFVLKILLDPTLLFAFNSILRNPNSFAWYPCLSLQNSVTIPWAHRCRYYCSVFQFCSWPGRQSGQYEIQMKRHVNKVASTCYSYYHRRLFQLRGCVRKNVMLHLVTSLILTRIDSSNSVLINLPVSTVAPLQRVQNTAARLVLGWTDGLTSLQH